MGIFLAAVALLGAGVLLFRQSLLASRRRYLNAYALPKGVMERFRIKHPELTPAQESLVCEGLRQYFQICGKAGRRFVSMPSQVVDDLWHEFILFTRNYQHFCTRAFGRYLHHTPAEAMSPDLPRAGIQRAWKVACQLEGIDAKQPSRLPLLFALDGQLGIANGFVYALDCGATPKAQSGGVHCASHIGCGGSCGSGGGASSDGAGCGGSSCGGGGCGGGD